MLVVLGLLLLTVNAENLDVATDIDQQTDEFTVENSAGSYGKSTVIIISIIISIIVVVKQKVK